MKWGFLMAEVVSPRGTKGRRKTILLNFENPVLAHTHVPTILRSEQNHEKKAHIIESDTSLCVCVCVSAL